MDRRLVDVVVHPGEPRPSVVLVPRRQVHQQVDPLEFVAQPRL